MSAYAVSALCIATVTLLALTAHSTVLKTGRIRPGMFCFYTNLSNLLVALYELALFFALTLGPAPVRRFLTAPVVALCVSACIWVTHIIYHFVLVPYMKKKGTPFADGAGEALGNLCVHYAVPLLTLLQWALWADKTGLRPLHALAWLPLPFAYFAFAMLRGRTGRPIGRTSLLYPYPFLDYPRLGPRRFWLGIAGLTVFFIAVGLVLVLAGQALGRVL